MCYCTPLLSGGMHPHFASASSLSPWPCPWLGATKDRSRKRQQQFCRPHQHVIVSVANHPNYYLLLSWILQYFGRVLFLLPSLSLAGGLVLHSHAYQSLGNRGHLVNSLVKCHFTDSIIVRAYCTIIFCLNEPTHFKTGNVDLFFFVFFRRVQYYTSINCNNNNRGTVMIIIINE